MSTDIHASHRQDHRTRSRRDTDVLIVGTLGGGGIHQYIEKQTEELSDDFSVSVYDMVRATSSSGPLWFIKALVRTLLALVRFPFRTPPDVVHVHTSHRFSFYRSAFYVLFASYVWRRPVILHVHGSAFDEFVRTDSRPVRWLQSLVFDASDRVLVLSEYWEGLLTDRVASDKLRVYPNAVSPEDYDPDFGGDPPHIVSVSNLIERKGIPELMAALDELEDRDVDFRANIAGKGALKDEVESFAEGRDRVDYLGYVSESRKHELLNSGAVFVLPTYAEGLPIAMLEGMAGGNAIVSTTVGSIPEVIDEDQGILVDPGDAEGLADALETLVADPEATEEMARRNREDIEARYSWDRTIERLESLYVDEVGRTAPPAR